MKERPILFSAPMVRAILDGSKSQTRRIVKPQPKDVWPEEGQEVSCTNGLHRYYWPDVKASIHDNLGGLHYSCPGFAMGAWKCPYGKPGDRLIVKESIKRGYCGDMNMSVYAADGYPTDADCWPWKLNTLPSMFCPIGLSRITLEIVNVRVDKLGHLTHDDAVAEGVGSIEEFKNLWRSINGEWDDKLWVWIVEFRKV